MKSVEYNPHHLGLNIKMKRFKSGQLVVVGQGREGIPGEERPKVISVKGWVGGASNHESHDGEVAASLQVKVYERIRAVR